MTGRVTLLPVLALSACSRVAESSIGQRPVSLVAAAVWLLLEWTHRMHFRWLWQD